MHARPRLVFARLGRLGYDEVDVGIREKYDISDVWDTSKSVPKCKKQFGFRWSGQNMKIVIKCKGGRLVRYACKDPRVGCIIFKLHLEMSDGDVRSIGEPNAASSEGGTHSVSGSKTSPMSLKVTRKIGREANALTPIEALHEAHRLYMRSGERLLWHIRNPTRCAHIAYTMENPTVSEFVAHIRQRRNGLCAKLNKTDAAETQVDKSVQTVTDALAPALRSDDDVQCERRA